MSEAKTKPADDEMDGVHRLRDILVEEVSLVDRAANQRRFLVVKRSEDMADENKPAEDEIEKAKKKPAEEDGDEDATEKAKEPADESDDDEEADETTKVRGASKDSVEEDEEDPAGKKKQQKKADLVIPAPVKQALLSTLTEALERLMALAKTIKEASEGDRDSGKMPEDVGTELEAIADMLWGVGKGKKTKEAKAEVTKAGARMAKDRLDRFQKALSLLADILKELTETKEPLAAPSAGVAEAGVTKRDAAPQPMVIPGLADLVSGIGELTRVVKRQEEELSRMRQARGVSNAIPVEGARRAEPQDVSWPLDMNRPISRDKVKKEVSFFDET